MTLRKKRQLYIYVTLQTSLLKQELFVVHVLETSLLKQEFPIKGSCFVDIGGIVDAHCLNFLLFC
jgi:hypothetical protein